jgi:hypothetical protein
MRFSKKQLIMLNRVIIPFCPVLVIRRKTER